MPELHTANHLFQRSSIVLARPCFPLDHISTCTPFSGWIELSGLAKRIPLKFIIFLTEKLMTGWYCNIHSRLVTRLHYVPQVRRIVWHNGSEFACCTCCPIHFQGEKRKCGILSLGSTYQLFRPQSQTWPVLLNHVKPLRGGGYYSSVRVFLLRQNFRSCKSTS